MRAETKRPRIFIGVPCYRDVTAELLEDWCRFFYHLGRRMPNYDFELGIKTKSEQFRARNAIVDGAQQTNCDWVLMLDDDMIINPFVTNGPTSDYGFLERLIAHDKDICGALYYQRTGGCEPVLMKAVGNGYRFLRDDELTGGLQRVDVAGGGCLLIKTRVFDKLQFPYFEPEFRYGTDIQLCRQALEKGMEVWADTSIELGHLRTERVIVTSRNRAQFQMTDTVPGEVKKSFVAADVYDRVLRDACVYTGYADLEEMTRHANDWIQERKASGLFDAEWYRTHGKERIARQVWFNTLSPQKRQMTEFILSAIDHRKPVRVLDFGCGIGIPAFTLAEKGHTVTAIDIRGTGTFEFLQWRAQQAGVSITCVASEGIVPDLGDAQFDVIIAMDTLEHIEGWRDVLGALASRLAPHGVFFANNGILDDQRHPEHYPLDNKDFIARCLDADLMPVNSITYVKRAGGAASSPTSQELAHA